MTRIEHVTDKLADAITEWAAARARYTELPDDTTLGKELDFVASATAWSVAKSKLVDSGIICRDGRRFYVS